MKCVFRPKTIILVKIQRGYPLDFAHFEEVPRKDLIYRAPYYISELLKSTFLTVSGDLELAKLAHKTSQSCVQNRPHLLQSAYYISISAADFHVLDKITWESMKLVFRAKTIISVKVQRGYPLDFVPFEEVPRRDLIYTF